MKILIYSFNDKIGDGLQKITFLQKIKDIYPNSIIYYTTSQTTTLKDKLNPLVKDIINDDTNINILNKNGCKIVGQPSGSINDKKIISFTNKNNISLYFIKNRLFKH